MEAAAHDDDATLAAAAECLEIPPINDTDVLAIEDDPLAGLDTQRQQLIRADLEEQRQFRADGSSYNREAAERRAEQVQRQRVAAEPAPARPLLRSLSFDEYVRGYEPATFLDGKLLQRRRLYSCTAKTGHAKTAVWTTLALLWGCDKGLPGCDVEEGLRVLYLSGENDHDEQTRVIGTSQELTVAPGDRFRVLPGGGPIGTLIEDIRADDQIRGPYDVIIADTSAAYFGGDDENDNPQLLAHARWFRVLTELPAGPAVVVLCHPVKNASRDNLIPRGGGAFLNEVDGNLTLWREGERAELHWQGKFRGPNFDPVFFELKPRMLDGIVDGKGRGVHSVVAVPIADVEVEKLAKIDWQDENRLLYVMAQSPMGSMGSWANECAWTTPEGGPLKSKVHRLLERLEKDKMVAKVRGKWTLTPAGKKEAEKP